jgi:prepilin-type N-terminal cleavage/methylation domain-containing protein
VTRGFTLVELLAVLAILGVGAGLAALALPSLQPPPGSDVLRSLAAARATAVRSGRAVVWRQGTVAVRFLPDGSSSGGSVLLDSLVIWVDPLTGATRAAR